MSNKTRLARHYLTGHTFAVRAGGAATAAEIERVRDPAPGDLWIAPALFDAQVNGFAAVDFQQDDMPLERLLAAARSLREAGCSQFFLTLISDHWETMIRRLQHYRQLRAESAELQTAIAGWHLEGPFLSSQPGYVGAHRRDVQIDPGPHHIEQLRAVTGTDPVLLTLAPERRGALAAIAACRAAGISVSLGHTNASAAELRDAVAAGATAFTHLGNACPQQIDRHDNILWRVLDVEGLSVMLIADGIHVSPPLFRLVHKAVASGRIAYVTDAMAAAGAPPGRYSIGPIDVEVGPDRIVREPGKPNFAGSALRPLEGIMRAADMLGRTWQEVWDKFAVHPRALFLPKTSLVETCVIQTNDFNAIESCTVIAAPFPSA